MRTYRCTRTCFGVLGYFDASAHFGAWGYFSFPSHSLHNYSLPSVPNIPHRPSQSPHIFYSCLHHEMLLSVIFKPSFSLLLISFTLFTFASAPARLSFTGFLNISYRCNIKHGLYYLAKPEQIRTANNAPSHNSEPYGNLCCEAIIKVCLHSTLAQLTRHKSIEPFDL